MKKKLSMLKVKWKDEPVSICWWGWSSLVEAKVLFVKVLSSWIQANRRLKKMCLNEVYCPLSQHCASQIKRNQKYLPMLIHNLFTQHVSVFSKIKVKIILSLFSPLSPYMFIVKFTFMKEKKKIACFFARFIHFSKSCFF